MFTGKGSYFQKWIGQLFLHKIQIQTSKCKWLNPSSCSLWFGPTIASLNGNAVLILSSIRSLHREGLSYEMPRSREDQNTGRASFPWRERKEFPPPGQKQSTKIGPNKGTANSQSNNECQESWGRKKTKTALLKNQRTFTGGEWLSTKSILLGILSTLILGQLEKLLLFS